MEDETAIKQNYLRTEIMDQNYDVEKFLAFISDMREDAADVDNWTLDELKEIVKTFKQNENALLSQTEKPDDNEVEQDETKEEIDKEKTKNIEETLSRLKINSDIYEETIDCMKIEHTDLTGKNGDLQILVSTPEKVPGGLFSSAYMTYLVTTSPYNFNVRRRYSDFEWLRNILFSHFPGIPIAPLPKKNYADRFQEQFILKRMRYLNKFLEGLSCNEIIVSTQIFQDFLKIENKDEFANKIKEYNKMKIPTKINEFKSLSGTFTLKLNKEYDNCFENFKTYLNFSELINKKLITSLKNLNVEMQAVSNRMQEVSDIFGQMYSASVKASDNQTVKQTYKMLNLLMKGWSDSNTKQANLIDLELKEYFNFIRKEFMSFKDIQVKVDNSKNVFSNAENRLKNRKEDIFKTTQTNNISKWELSQEDIKKYELKDLMKNKDLSFCLMLPKETQMVNTLRKEYAYYINQFFSQYEKLANLKGERFKKHFTMISEKHADILADLHVKWADLLSFYSDSYESNSNK